jgi:acyl-CoA:acyl-CoA alkyltransferase
LVHKTDVEKFVKSKFMKKTVIKALSSYLPDKLVTNDEIENKINFDKKIILEGALKRIFGGNTRYFAADNEQVSDMAVAAALKILKNNQNDIDLIIFAAASSDLIEPATANIIQYKLGLNCPAMDIKNACNSFLSAIEVATAFIESNVYQNILIVNAERLSLVINFNPKNDDELSKSMAGFTLGDAGTAMLLGTGNGSKIHFQKTKSWGEYWALCTVEGGGSLGIHNPEKYYFECDSSALKNAFFHYFQPFFVEAMAESGWKTDEIDCVVTHQVAAATTPLISMLTGISEEKFVNTFALFGNTAAATIPLAIDTAVATGKLKKGHKLAILGLAAGISISIHLIEW